MAVSLNKNSFCSVHGLTPFASTTTFARIDFLRQGGRLVIKKGTHNVKILTENKTKQIMPFTRGKETETESTYVYNRQRKRLPRMQLTANGGCIR